MAGFFAFWHSSISDLKIWPSRDIIEAILDFEFIRKPTAKVILNNTGTDDHVAETYLAFAFGIIGRAPTYTDK
ncbi:hypothetical protein J7337_013144 [Fusarium musae]|uniref:Uncharacterized protein n=1 Tax=Fusarium musae TaxID=1042133 RepID=A0A9P8IH52_9HYPO|nr:hypothetical protein J7337_013144 [Fusarium musae]KAG9494915.1 hypothetical protein J7337_013144 [Fusarium musae]